MVFPIHRQPYNPFMMKELDLSNRAGAPRARDFPTVSGRRVLLTMVVVVVVFMIAMVWLVFNVRRLRPIGPPPQPPSSVVIPS